MKREKRPDMKVTPWEVSGHIDYEKLVKQFGTKHITAELLKKLEKHTGQLHFMLRRKIFFSHRDFDWLLDKAEKGEKFVLYTGRGPSGSTHIAHVMPWIMCKWLQDKFDTQLYFQLTDDEKFLQKDLTLEETNRFAYENALDVIAMGFDPEKTKLIINTEHVKSLYRIALKVSKLTTFSTAKAVFGFDNSTNVGLPFYTCMQAAPCFLPTEISGKKTPVLIPAAIDQDPYWRITRDVADRLGYYKPAAIHCTFLPGLQGPDSKMSASLQDSAIFTTDTPEVARKKIMKSFSGGAQTLKEHKEKGGDPGVDTACQYLYQMFEPDDEKIKEIFDGYRKGSITTGEVKELLAKRLSMFLSEHQKKREHAKKQIDRFLLND
jgi:tryptophanyl-tRNA synthetase